ncbi:unnamed protein product, partial [Amoebophrya sp. A120]
DPVAKKQRVVQHFIEDTPPAEEVAPEKVASSKKAGALETTSKSGSAAVASVPVPEEKKFDNTKTSSGPVPPALAPLSTYSRKEITRTAVDTSTSSTVAAGIAPSKKKKTGEEETTSTSNSVPLVAVQNKLKKQKLDTTELLSTCSTTGHLAGAVGGAASAQKDKQIDTLVEKSCSGVNTAGSTLSGAKNKPSATSILSQSKNVDVKQEKIESKTGGSTEPVPAVASPKEERVDIKITTTAAEDEDVPAAAVVKVDKTRLRRWKKT